MLVHMTPGEVQGLQALALSHGGSLTINPHTGLPEAGFLKNILPALVAAAAIYFTGGAAAPALAGEAAAAAGAGGFFGLGSAGTGALAGGITGALTNKQNPLQGALMGGLSGWGVGGAMGALGQTGATALGAQAAGAATPAMIEAGTQGAAGAAMEAGALNPALAQAAPTTALQNYSAGLQQLGEKGGLERFGTALGENYGGQMGKMAAGIGAIGALGGFEQPELGFVAPQQQPSNYWKQRTIRREYDPSAPGGYYFADRGILQPNFLAAKGGEVPSVPELEDGGFVLTKKAVDGIGKGSNDRGQRAAAAGLGAIPIKGPGTGTSDSIPTTIDGKRPALVSNGEAYVPRDQVKRRGGAKKFYALMKAAERKATRA